MTDAIRCTYVTPVTERLDGRTPRCRNRTRDASGRCHSHRASVAADEMKDLKRRLVKAVLAGTPPPWETQQDADWIEAAQQLAVLVQKETGE